LSLTPVNPVDRKFGNDNECPRKFRVNLDGSVYAKNQITTDSSLIVGKEVNRTATGDANMIPIAYGYVNAIGGVVSNASTSNLASLLPLFAGFKTFSNLFSTDCKSDNINSVSIISASLTGFTEPSM